MLKDVKDFIQEIESKSKKLISVCLNIFLNHRHQLIMRSSLLILVQMKTKDL